MALDGNAVLRAGVRDIALAAVERAKAVRDLGSGKAQTIREPIMLDCAVRDSRLCRADAVRVKLTIFRRLQ